MIARLIVQTCAGIGLMGLLLFVAAGTLHWPGAWVFLVQLGVLGLASGLWLARADPDLLRERMSPFDRSGQDEADRMLMKVLAVALFAWLMLMALDACRFRWSHVPFWVHAAGAVAILVAFAIIHWTVLENPFAIVVVRVQRERGQHVITTGPYQFVRHPMYAGAIFFFIGTPLLLGSWYGLIGALIMIALFGVRITIEERALRAELEGYAEYAADVPYRLIPGVW